MDLPVWQALHEELQERGFTVMTVAMDSGGAADARQWIEAAKPTHPSLIDIQHVVAELYDWVNVPSNAWIDEEGRLVRPNDPGFAGEYFRGMMEPGFDFKAMMAEYGRMRDGYLDAVRDWSRTGRRAGGRSRPTSSASGSRRRTPITRAHARGSGSGCSSTKRAGATARRRRSP